MKKKTMTNSKTDPSLFSSFMEFECYIFAFLVQGYGFLYLSQECKFIKIMEYGMEKLGFVAKIWDLDGVRGLDGLLTWGFA